MTKTVIIVGSGNAALSAGIAALEKGADVTIYEKADKKMAGGNTKYTAGAMRFSYDNSNQLMDLLKNPNDERLYLIRLLNLLLLFKVFFFKFILLIGLLCLQI